MASEQYQVVVVGAGAAGLACARRVRAAGLSVVVLEARDRIGGRAHTITSRWPLDLGCGWLHSADQNPFSGIAEKLDFEIDRSPPPWMKQSALQDVTAEEMKAYRADFDALEERLEQAAQTGVDRPASELLDPSSRFNGGLNAFSAAYNGAEFDQVSVLDYAAYEDSGVNWRLPDGYGALVEAYGAGVPVRLGAAVQIVDHAGPDVKVTTQKGQLVARAVVIAVPTDVLADGAIRFIPELPDKADAAAGLPLGLANKQFLEVEGAEELPVDGHLFRRLNRVESGSYHLRPFGRPLIECYFGGRLARGLEAEGPGAFAAFATEELVGLLGSSWRKRLSPTAASAWAADPWARGSYSHALPGHAGDRARLAAPVGETLFWAGEATSPQAFSTAHGAYESGIRAGEEVVRALAAE